MKTSVKIIFLIMTSMQVMGCSLFDGDNNIINNKNKIKLTASVDYTRATRSESFGILDPDTDVELPISMVRIDESDANYPEYINPGYNALSAIMGKPDTGNNNIRDIEFTDGCAQFYHNPTDTIKFLGWYPRGTFSSTADGMSITNNIDGKTDILLSEEASGSKNTGFSSVKFNHKLCQYRIFVYTMSDSLQNHIWGELTDIKLVNQATKCVFQLPKTTTYLDYTRDISLADSNGELYFTPGKIPIGFANMQLAGFVMAAPQQDGILNMKISTQLIDETVTDISIARDFRAGYSYDIVLRFSDNMYINADVSINEWQDGNTVFDYIETDKDINIYYDLSRYGTANSYIVSSANNNYAFLANVKGNGNGTPVGVSNSSIDITNAYADIIWSESSDGQDIISMTSNQLSNGYIKFFIHGALKTDGSGEYDATKLNLTRKGNALIGLYDSPAKTNLLWSWHIWITDKPKEQGYINGYSVLDRNLGAISSKSTDGEQTYGLYYQWGRKDPLRRNGTTYSASHATIETSVKNPTTLYNSNANTSMTYQSDWTTTSNNHLWGFIDQGNEYEKTIYDPCPPGYRVPERRIWTNLSSYESETIGLFNLGSLEIWYPGAGYMNNGTYNNDGNCYIYSAHAQNSSGSIIYAFRWDGNVKGIQDITNRSNALPIRCISTEVKSIVTNLSKTSTANSYIISSDGYYRFSVLKRGNGVTSILTSDDISGGLSPNIDTSRITSIEPLWWQGDLTLNENERDYTYMPVEVVNPRPDKNGNAIIYIDEFRKGNVILAAYNGSKIIWTWHIWLTDQPVDIMTNEIDGGSYKIMDRNLGATYSSVDSGKSWTTKERLAFYGFYYQWGRKDPFPGPPTYNAGSSISSSIWYKKAQGNDTWTAQNTIYVKSDVAEQTIAYSAENPTVFMPKNTADLRWQTSIEQSANYSVRMWGYAVGSATGNSLTKTFYDPCPPGYHAPTHQSWYYAEINDDQEGSTQKTYTANDASGYNGHYFTYAGWYMPNGYRDAQTGYLTNVGTYSYTYSAMPMSNSGARYMRIGRTTSRQYMDDSPANARAMRCQKD